MSDPLSSTGNSGLPQLREEGQKEGKKQKKRQGKAAVAGRHVTSEALAKHLESPSRIEVMPNRARAAARAVEPVYSKMGTELTPKSNPFAKRPLLVEARNVTASDINCRRVRLNSYSSETIEPNNARLHIKILKNAVLITEKKMHEAMQRPSPYSLGKLFDSIQECYIKGYKISQLFQRWQSPPADINPDQINQLITDFENHFIHFLMLCKPSLQAQQQDLFFMCTWYLSHKEVRQEKNNANFLHICRKSASLFLVSRLDDFNPLLAKERLSKPGKNVDSISTDDLSLLLLGHLTNLCLPGAAYNIHSDRMITNIKKQLQTDPLFQDERKEEQFDHVLAELEMQTTVLTNLDALDESLKSPAQDDTSHEYSPGKPMVCNIGFNPYQPSAPGIGLLGLERIYRHAQLPAMREDINTHLRVFAQRDDPFNRAFFALFQFLAGDTSDTHIESVANDDLKLYLRALIHYLQGQWLQAEQLAEKSQWPEASWLLGQLYYRRGNLSEAIANIRKALDFGVESALLQLVNLLLEAPTPDWKNIECLLGEAVPHYRYTCSKVLGVRIHYMATQLQLAAPEWAEDDLLSTPPATGRKKPKGKKKGLGHASVPYLSEPRLAQLNLLCIDALCNQDYDRALQLLVDASQKISWGFQQAVLAIMDLWRLAEIGANQDYLYMLHCLAVSEDQSLKIAMLRQDSKLLRAHGLTSQQGDNITLTDSVATIVEKLGNRIIEKSMDWLCFLHDTPDIKQQWRQTPAAVARQQMENFEYSPTMTFMTALLLTTVACVFKGKTYNDADSERTSQSRHLSIQFFEAAGEFYNWQNRLNGDHKLKSRIEAATPLGSPQKLAKTPPKNRNLASESRPCPTKKPEQQPRSDQSDAQKAIERVVVDVIDHTTSDANNENGRPKGPERNSNTAVV